jgi:hypothetical protein
MRGQRRGRNRSKSWAAVVMTGCLYGWLPEIRFSGNAVAERALSLLRPKSGPEVSMPKR